MDHPLRCLVTELAAANRTTSSSAFFDALEASFEQIARVTLPSWLEQDALRIFRRRIRR